VCFLRKIIKEVMSYYQKDFETMNCQQVNKAILEGNITDEARKHIAVCSNCAEQLEWIEATMERVGREGVTEQDPFFYTRLKARMEQPVRISFWTQQRKVLVQVANVASIAIAGLFLGLLMSKELNLKVDVFKSNHTNRQEVMKQMLDDHHLQVDSRELEYIWGGPVLNANN
jgi:hypothetical protein